ncbi:cytochrome P450 2J2-like [Kogia breviceps]|uniref:cytochrome P450 2J2-like n=1 Tax=Kogia breviceps TaxID=27615 RepID=UPI002795723C|nr:cytochrome P450 2J5-like [Kogia breviceps]
MSPVCVMLSQNTISQGETPPLPVAAPSLAELTQALAQAHGNVFTMWVGPTPVVVLSGFRVVKEALVSNSEQLSGRPLTQLFRDLFGERGVICSNGHTWRQQRRFCLVTLQELGRGKLALELQLQGEAAELAEAFHQEQGRPFDPRVHIVTSTARVIGALVFGRCFLLEDPFLQELIQAIDFGLASVNTIWRKLSPGSSLCYYCFHYCLDYFGSVENFQMTSGSGMPMSEVPDHFGAPSTILSCPDSGSAPEQPLGGPLPPQLYDLFLWAFRRRPGPHQEMFRYQKAVRGYICREISRHKLRTPEAPKDFISCYLAQIIKATADPVSTLNEENLIQVVVDLFLGGTDTTATTLCWALIYMVQHGAIQERVQRELDEVLGTSRAVRYEGRERLPNTRAVLHEEQRLSSVVTAGAVRQCVTSTRVRDHPVPKSTIILPNLASVFYDSECWETPQQFNPGHFRDKDGNFLVNEAFLPFSAGHRVCLGDQLVWMELFLMFATLLRTFWFQLPERSPGLRLEYIFGGTRQPRPQKICAVPRLNCLNPGPREEGV